MVDPKQFAGTDEAVRGLMRHQQVLQSKVRGTKRETPALPIPRHERGDRFVRGPIPYLWLRTALSLGGKAGNLAWAIWWLVGIEKTNPIRMTGRTLRNFHVSPRAARRLLSRFEQAGLVRIDRKRGRGPLVTLLTPRSENSTVDRNDRAELPINSGSGLPEPADGSDSHDAGHSAT